MALLIEMALRRRPLSEAEWCRWASATAARNGTRTAVAPDMRKWYIYAKGRILREHGINIEEVGTQQLSTARSGVLLSGVRAFVATINELLADHPELAAEGLDAHGNYDESKLDLNAILQRDALVPEGSEAQWEVEGERCAQITFLGGFQGYRDKQRGAERGRHSSLGAVMEQLRGQRSAESPPDVQSVLEPLCEEESALPAAVLPSAASSTAGSAPKPRGVGWVAGYPKLQPGFWDDDDFCILPGLLIFNAGDTAPDPAWSNLVRDKDRLLVASTESGYVNTDLKHTWYKHSKAQPFLPWGKRPTLPTADHHSSNESIEMSIEMEGDACLLSGGPGHSTHLLQDLDQRGGPIQHWKRILGALVCHSYRIHGALSRARIAQAVELAYVLSFTPAVCAYATTRVGWGEDTDGKLKYDPLACPHIFSRLVDDESFASTATAVVVPPSAESLHTATAAERLAMFRAGALDGVPGIAAARASAREILGKGERNGDGWDNEEDMPDGTIDAAGSRARRNRNDKGSVVASASFRASRDAEGKTAADKAAADRLKLFKARRTDMIALEFNTLAEAKLAAGEELSNDEMAGFIRARTNRPVPQKEKNAPALRATLATLRSKPVVIKLSMEPDGYGEWAAEAAASKAGKAGAKGKPTAAAKKAGKAARTASEESESEPESEFDDASEDKEQYEVEAILGHKGNGKARRFKLSCGWAMMIRAGSPRRTLTQAW